MMSFQKNAFGETLFNQGKSKTYTDDKSAGRSYGLGNATSGSRLDDKGGVSQSSGERGGASKTDIEKNGSHSQSGRHYNKNKDGTVVEKKSAAVDEFSTKAGTMGRFNGSGSSKNFVDYL